MLPYKKYRWMYTSGKKLVFGGKNAEQNEEVASWLIREAKKGKDYIVMHTAMPGSPFAVLFSDKHDEKDIMECAVFCASYSRAWRSGKKNTSVDIFHSSQIFKDSGMKEGTLGVFKKVRGVKAELKLCLEVQEGKLRGVPYQKEKKSFLICLKPGSISKEKTAEEIARIVGFKKQEVLEALPTGGFAIDNI